MRRIALAAVAATVLVTASRAAATDYTFSFFTFNRSTKLLVGTICDNPVNCDPSARSS